jgi:hypothetical protein
MADGPAGSLAQHAGREHGSQNPHGICVGAFTDALLVADLCPLEIVGLIERRGLLLYLK